MDDAAFDGFVSARYGALVRTAELLTGDRGHAEDLVQTALMKCYSAVSRGAQPHDMEPYVRSAMLRQALRWRMRRWHGERPAESVPDRPAAQSDAELATVVRAALMRLPAQQRAVLVLRYFEDHTEAETARLLACSVGTVKSRASRGLAALRACGLLIEEVDHAR